MKYSSALLKKFISINDTPENIADNLILKTCEIEEIIERKIPEEVVIGYVTEVKKHPNADKLTVCQVDCGDKWSFQILCGAKNVTEGMYVPAALSGAYLSQIDIKIEPRKMKWLDSDGMICAKEELGILEDLEEPWIWILNDDFDDLEKSDLGIPLAEKYPWLNSYVFDVDNKWLTHRPDLTGHFGIGVELNAIYSSAKPKDKGQRSLISFNKISEYYKTFENTNIFETLNQSKKCTMEVESKTDGLRSYILMELNDVEVKESTFFTRLQLLDLGLHPRNNRVDISNLMLFLTGQPVHFFDAAKIDWNIIVRNAQKWEKFIDLFEKEHSLLETDLVIVDEKKILALAWVIGSLNSWVTETTKNIVVEIANFDPVLIRRTWTRLGLRTDAEIRFEKNINPIYSLYSLFLFMDILGYYVKDLGKYEHGGLDYYIAADRKKSVEKIIEIDLEKMQKIIFGQEKKNFTKLAQWYLEGLGFKVKNEKWGMIDVGVPFWRGPGDINIEDDITEEVARLYGYDNIDPIPLYDQMVNQNYSSYVDLQRKLENFWVQDACFDQVETYPWVSTKVLQIMGRDLEVLYSLQNAVDPEAPYLRDMMLYNLLQYVAKNSKFFDEIRFFDIGKIRSKVDGSDKGVEKLDKTFEGKNYAWKYVNERQQFGWILYRKQIWNWQEDTVLEIKDLLKNLFGIFEVGDLDIVWVATGFENYHPKKQAKIQLTVNSKQWIVVRTLGFVGVVHPLVNKAFKISENASLTYVSLYLDVLVEAIEEANKDKKYIYQTLQDQIVSRDLCFVIDSKISFGVLLDAVESVNEVENLKVFDIYEWESLGVGKKSIAFKFDVIGEGNMTTEYINEVMNKVIVVAEKTGAKLRE